MRHILAITLMAGFAFMVGCTEPEVADTPTKPERPAKASKAPRVSTAQGGPTIGEEAPEISGVDLDGVEFKLSDYRGKVVMLDFYGDW